MRRRNREMLQWIRRVITPYALVVPGDSLKAKLQLFFVCFVSMHVRATRVKLRVRFSCAHFADHVIEADLDSAAGMTALWRFLGDGVALFCIAHRYTAARVRNRDAKSKLDQGDLACLYKVRQHFSDEKRFYAPFSIIRSSDPYICFQLLAGIASPSPACHRTEPRAARKGGNRFQFSHRSRVLEAIAGVFPLVSLLVVHACGRSRQLKVKVSLCLPAGL